MTKRQTTKDTRLIAKTSALYAALEAFLISEKKLRDAGWKAECDKALAAIEGIRS